MYFTILPTLSYCLTPTSSGLNIVYAVVMAEVFFTMLVNENQPLKMNFFFGFKVFFTRILISNIGVEINLMVMTKNNASDPEIEFLTKSISKPDGRATAIPTALRLIKIWVQRVRNPLDSTFNESK